MKMKFILNYIFKFILLISFVGIAQNTTDSTSIEKKYGIRIGIDAHRLAKSFYDKNYKGLELVADYRLTNRFYIAGEFGSEEKTTEDDNLNFTTKGTYIKVGFDYNAYENWLKEDNMLYAGMRYAVSSMNHKLNHYNIYDQSNYYGQNNVISNKEFKSLSASWVEVIGGIKLEVINNLYAGFSLRIHYLVSNKKPENFDNLYIPGFNKTYDGNFGASLNYTISYRIPLYKKSSKI